jgi:hypothetical protein
MASENKKELRQMVACQWLDDNYINHGHLRHDIVTDRLQIRMPNLESLSAPHNATSVIGDPAEDAASGYSLEFRGKDTWRNLTDKDINSMVCQCVAETQVNISTNEMFVALKSDLVPAVHPIRDWLNNLPPYTPDQPDWIDWLASQVQVRSGAPERLRLEDAALESADAGGRTKVLEDDPQRSDLQCSDSETIYSEAIHNNVIYSEQRERSKTDAYWRQCFKKWFVAMVASWMNDEVVNHTVLVFVGRQGIFKTTWMDHLIPPALRAYSSKMPLSGQITKDDRLRLCENAMLNIDELDAICGREMNIVKSLLTSTDVNERAAYGRLKERRVRLASFCASTNNREFLTDITGNRRWLPFEVESIVNPFHITLPYEQIYAQAKALVEEGLFEYWFDQDEIQTLEKHNEEFRAQENEEQLLPILFDVPAEGRGEFMTTAEISDRLVAYGGIKKPMSLNRLGVLLGKAGYKKKTVGKQRVRGWIVYKLNDNEINANRNINAK